MGRFGMKLAVVLAAIFATTIGAAQAASSDPSAFYVGLGYNGIDLTAKAAGLPTSLTAGGDIHIGERFSKYLAIEASFSGANAEHDVATGAGGANADKMTVYGPNIDALVYLPLWTDKFSLIGTIGATYDVGKSSIETEPAGIAQTTTTQKSVFGGRGGVGLELRPARFFSIDLIGRYQTTTFKGYGSGAKVATMDFNIYF